MIDQSWQISIVLMKIELQTVPISKKRLTLLIKVVEFILDCIYRVFIKY
jgi:hypothetical protein